MLIYMKRLIIFLTLGMVCSLNKVKFGGRWLNYENDMASDWPGSQIQFQVSGVQSISITIGKQPQLDLECDDVFGVRYIIDVFINNIHWGKIDSKNSLEGNLLQIVSNLNESQSYNIKLIKITEARFSSENNMLCGVWSIRQINLNGDNPQFITNKLQEHSRKYLFIGDSITVGYGVEANAPCQFTPQTENNDLTNVKLLSDLYNVTEYQAIAWSGKGVVKNYGDLEPANNTIIELFEYTLAQSQKFIWKKSDFYPELISINIGTNDYSTIPLSDSQIYIDKLSNFIVRTLHENYPQAKIIVACGPMVVPGSPWCPNVQQCVQQSNMNIGGIEQFVFYQDFQNILDPNEYGCDTHPNYLAQIKMSNILSKLIDQIMNY